MDHLVKSIGVIAFNSRRILERVESGEDLEVNEVDEFVFGVVKEELFDVVVTHETLNGDEDKMEEYVGKEECEGVEVREGGVNRLQNRLDQI